MAKWYDSKSRRSKEGRNKPGGKKKERGTMDKISGFFDGTYSPLGDALNKAGSTFKKNVRNNINPGKK